MKNVWIILSALIEYLGLYNYFFTFPQYKVLLFTFVLK